MQYMVVVSGTLRKEVEADSLDDAIEQAFKLAEDGTIVGELVSVQPLGEQARYSLTAPVLERITMQAIDFPARK